MPIVNLTPHPIDIYASETPDVATDEELAAGLRYSLPPAGGMARLVVDDLGEDPSVEIGGITVPVYGVRYGKVDGLPEPAEGVQYVVPMLTALAVEDRTDLLIVHQQVRNTRNTVAGCKSFGRCR